MTTTLNDALVSAWVTGWARTRQYREQHEGSIHAALRYAPDPLAPLDSPDNEWEYVVANPSTAALQTLSETVNQFPQRLLTVVTDVPENPEPVGTAAERAAQASQLKQVGAGEKLMTTNLTDDGVHDVEPPIIPEEYQAQVDRNDGWFLVSFVTTDEHSQGEGTVAARGRVAAVDGFAVFDQIWTFPEFRRQGLGSLIMRYLTSLALDDDVETGLLIAGLDGQALYGYLGWTELADVSVLSSFKADRDEDNLTHIKDR